MNVVCLLSKCRYWNPLNFGISIYCKQYLPEKQLILYATRKCTQVEKRVAILRLKECYGLL